MELTLHFAFEKETKGAVRYKEVDAEGKDAFDAKIGTVYVRKSALPGKIVQKFTMTLKGE